MTGRERLKLLVWSVVYLVGGFFVGTLIIVPFAPLMLDPEAGYLRIAAVQTAGLLVGFGLLSWLIGTKVLHFSRSDFEQLPPAAKGSRRAGRFGWGALLGTAMAVIALAIAVPAGQAGWHSDGGTFSQWTIRLGITALVLLPAALSEELAFRGLPLMAVARAVGRLPAIIGIAALFALAHVRNPDVTPLALVNIALAGIWLGLAFMSPGGLWTSTGAHLGWNLTLAGLGAPVSGLPLPMPWLDYAPGAPSWLTGGAFGPEGGVLASLCLLGGSVLVGRVGKPQSPTTNHQSL